MSANADRLPPGQYEPRGWPVLHVGGVPRIDLTTWRFRVFGAVAEDIELTYDEFRALPQAQVHADFHCVTKFSVFDNDWEGVAFRTVYELAAPEPSVTHVMAWSHDGYCTNVPLAALLDDDVLFAWARNGEPLTPDHGGPLRLIVPKRYAWKSAKWIKGIELMTRDRRGFWEERGYHNDADPWREERYSYQESGHQTG